MAVIEMRWAHFKLICYCDYVLLGTSSSGLIYRCLMKYYITDLVFWIVTVINIQRAVQYGGVNLMWSPLAFISYQDISHVSILWLWSMGDISNQMYWFIRYVSNYTFGHKIMNKIPKNPVLVHFPSLYFQSYLVKYEWYMLLSLKCIYDTLLH